MDPFDSSDPFPPEENKNSFGQAKKNRKESGNPSEAKRHKIQKLRRIRI